MSLAQVIRTIFEIALIVFTLWAVFHEDVFISFEERIIAAFKRKRFKIVNGSIRTVR